MKKAVLFTLSMLLLVTLVFSLSLIFSDLNKYNADRFSELSILDRLYDIDSSLQNSIKKVFNAYSGIITDINKLNVTIQESLPNANKNQFNEKINSFKNYTESQFNNIKLDIDQLNNNAELIINGISYNHNNNFGGNIINIVPKQINFDTYYFRFYSSAKNGIINWPTAPSGNLRVIIVADAPEWHNEKIQNIDPSKTTTATISGIGIDNIELIFSNLGKVKIENKAAADVSLKTAIAFNSLNDKIHVYLPNIINIAFSQFNISKLGHVKIV